MQFDKPKWIDSEKVIIQIENDAEKAFHSSDERVAHLAPFALAVILCTHTHIFVIQF